MELSRDESDLVLIRTLQRRVLRLQKLITVLSIIGLGFSITVCEMCQIITESDELCSGTFINFLKTMSMLSTIATVGFIIWQASLSSRINSTVSSLSTRHTKFKFLTGDGIVSNRKESLLSRDRFLTLFFAFFNAIHTFPGVSYLVSANMLGMRVVYRVESMLTLVMLFRLVHVAILHKYQTLASYLKIDDTIIVRNTKTIQLMKDPSINFSVLAFKLVLARRPIRFIVSAAVILLFVSTYMIRIAEVTAPPLWKRSTFVICDFADTRPHRGRPKPVQLHLEPTLDLRSMSSI